MFYNDVMYRNTIEQVTFSIKLLLVFLKNISFAITLTWPKTVFTKKTLIFSKTVNEIHIKML